MFGFNAGTLTISTLSNTTGGFSVINWIETKLAQTVVIVFLIPFLLFLALPVITRWCASVCCFGYDLVKRYSA